MASCGGYDLSNIWNAFAQLLLVPNLPLRLTRVLSINREFYDFWLTDTLNTAERETRHRWRDITMPKDTPMIPQYMTYIDAN